MLFLRTFLSEPSVSRLNNASSDWFLILLCLLLQIHIQINEVSPWPVVLSNLRCWRFIQGHHARQDLGTFAVQHKVLGGGWRRLRLDSQNAFVVILCCYVTRARPVLQWFPCSIYLIMYQSTANLLVTHISFKRWTFLAARNTGSGATIMFCLSSSRVSNSSFDKLLNWLDSPYFSLALITAATCAKLRIKRLYTLH